MLGERSGNGVTTNGRHPPLRGADGQRPSLPGQATPAPLACTSAWYDERTIGPDATWLKPSA
jgi:hypothetical protein